MAVRFSLVAQAVVVVLAIVAIAVIPSVIELFAMMQLTLFAAMAVLALSLAFIWGFGGILSFGQTAFFGLGGYAYAISAVNFQDRRRRSCSPLLFQRCSPRSSAISSSSVASPTSILA